MASETTFDPWEVVFYEEKWEQIDFLKTPSTPDINLLEYNSIYIFLHENKKNLPWMIFFLLMHVQDPCAGKIRTIWNRPEKGKSSEKIWTILRPTGKWEIICKSLDGLKPSGKWEIIWKNPESFIRKYSTVAVSFSSCPDRSQSVRTVLTGLWQFSRFFCYTRKNFKMRKNFAGSNATLLPRFFRLWDSDLTRPG